MMPLPWRISLTKVAMEQGRGGISGGDCEVLIIMRMVMLMTTHTREAVEES